MDHGEPPTRRFWVYLLVVVASGALAVVWFIPQLSKADQRAPVHTEVGFSRHCAESAVDPPNYGTREPVSYCDR